MLHSVKQSGPSAMDGPISVTTGGVHMKFNVSAITIDRLDTEWFDASRAFKIIRSIAEDWNSYGTENAVMDDLGDVLMELWYAQSHLVPYPDIAVLRLEKAPAGILYSVDWPLRQRFFIESLIVHPMLQEPNLVQSNWYSNGWSKRLLIAVPLGVGMAGWKPTLHKK